MKKFEYPDDQRALLESLSQPFAVYQFIDNRVVTLVLSQGFCDLFGYDDLAQAYHGMDNDMYKNVHPDDVARVVDSAYTFATEGESYDVIYRTKVAGATKSHIVHAMGKRVHTDTGIQLAQVWYTDEGTYTEGESEPGSRLNHTFNNALHEGSLVHASNYDQVTGLPNMTYFFELADAGKKSIIESGYEPVMLFFDLCGMKYYNTQNGFTSGDALLKEFANVLKDTFSNESCCHVGADHFAAFTVNDGLEDMLERFFEECSRINNGNNLPVRVGIYKNSLDDVYVSVACDRAKFACDSLRNSYGSCFGYYDCELRDNAEKRRYVLANLDKALDEGWIHVYYQPIVRAVNGRVCDEEALSRWFDPEMGMLSPADFIPALEDAKVIYKLDLYVLEQVLDKMKRQEAEGFKVVPHSINLSRSDFVACDIVDEVSRRVDEAGLSHEMITVEVTESTVGDDLEFMKRQIGRFRELGFPVWMDDFGSGYSSVDMLQTMEFDLIKFDMSFMRRLEDGESAKIVLAELMKLATALGVGTVCEGVETDEQVKFLQEIGCSKMQGYYFCKPVSLEDILERYNQGIQIGYENPLETSYYDAIGGVNLYDLSVISNEDDGAFKNYFNTLPMGILEIGGDEVEFVRTNQSYRDFMKRYFVIDVEENPEGYDAVPFGAGSTFMQLVHRCCDKGGGRAFFDETMPDGSIVHSFARSIGQNPVTGKNAAAIAVLSVTEAGEGATYASIARALAADYYNIYYVDLDTEKFIEYSSPVGGEDLAIERHGEDFFEASRRDTMTRIYEGDRETFLASFSKEKIEKALDAQGVFTASYRLIDTGEPMFVNMKVTRMHPGSRQIIMGISIVDPQMKRKEYLNKIMRERDVLSKVIALSENYLSLYTIDARTGSYIEYNATSEYESLGLEKRGDDFFREALENGKRAICPDDLPMFLEEFTFDKVLEAIRERGAYMLQYRLMIKGEPKLVSLRIARVKGGDGDELVAGIRAWKTRRQPEAEDSVDQ